MKQNKYFEVEVKVGNDTRKVAFAKGINREVNLANVKKLYAEMKVKGYRKAEIIQVIRAEEAIANGDIVLIDINGNEINKEDANGYYLIIDGQHRVYAVSMLNFEQEKQRQPTFQVPSILVELAEKESVAEYISAVNITKTPWKTDDYVRGAANVKQEELLARYKELIKSEDNPNGFPLSTLNIIYCNNPKAMNKTSLSLLCQGKDEKGRGKVKKPIIPAHNIERGDHFIELCKAKGFSDKDISKRYLSERFSDLFNEGGEDKAFEIFSRITPNDCQAMHNDKGNLIEEKVIEQFKLIEDRIA
ncbi:hypothetical protein [Caecibacteroides pullorum]|uniref:Uncharacterized protein n=1 Tax=Caecibacteroides pullorum TaxID=2725562 RepID=A0AA41DDI9_9BACT|nr:hypothetical protein [Caecibacteroides pullorum]MBM6858842.1 hypothetical protein [Caecibacteroides pullorum]MBV8059852.1 hypothetical protein [Caecibacteroides pullorum]